MAESRETLVSVLHAHGTAGVWRGPDGRRWLSAWLEHGGGTLLEDTAPPSIASIGELTVQGGVLPPGAATAHVIDDTREWHDAATAAGVWVVVLAQHSHGASPVLYRDADGRPVRPQLPSDWSVEPVPDANGSCPACGGARWERVTPTDTESRGGFGTAGGGMAPSSVLVCVVCGHEEPIPTFFGASGGDWDDTPDDEVEMASHRTPPRALAGVDFPVYAIGGRDARLGGYGSSSAGIDSVDVAHGSPEDGPWIVVSTERGQQMESDATVAREALGNALSSTDEPWPHDLSEAALSLWLHTRDRDRRRLAAEAPLEPIALPVDGSPVEFQLVRSGEHWAAAARVADDLGVTVSACGIDPSDLALERMRNPGGLAASGPA
jgi:hypothetical protein